MPPPSAARPTPWLVLVPVVVASLAMLAWMGRSLVTGEIPFTGDLLHFHYPLRDFYARALISGHAFDWMPGLYSGFYVVGEGQLGAYHPLHLLLYRVLPLNQAFAIELVVAYPVLFVGVWRWLGRRCGPTAAAFGAMGATFSGFTLVHGVHPNIVGVLAHVPWMLLTLDRASRATSWRQACSAVAALALLTGSQLLVGHPQSVWFSGLITLAYAAHLAWSGAEPARTRVLGACISGLGLGLVLGAAQALPTLDALRHSTRPEYNIEFATAFSLEPRRLSQLVHPFLAWGRIARWNEAPGAGDEYGVYGGAVLALLAVWWLAWSIAARHDSDDERRFGWLVGAFGACGAWLATGAHGGLYYAQTWLPYVNQFRAPVRYTLFTQWALAVLAALAVGRLIGLSAGLAAAGLRAAGAAADRIALGVVWLFVAVATVSVPLLNAPSGATGVAVWWGPMVLGLAALLLTAAARGARGALAGVVLLAAVDLGVYGLSIPAWQDFLTRQAAVGYLDTNGFLPVAGPGRLARGGFPNLFVLSQHRLLDGYLAITPTRQLDYHQPQALRVAQVEYAHADYLQGASIPGAEPRDRGWRRLPAPLPRARLVTAATVSASPAADLARIDVDTTALVTHDLRLAAGEAGTARIVVDDPGRVRIVTSAASAQLLVVSESFDEGWTAAVDDTPVPVERVNGDFLGVVAPRGVHTIAFVFRPAHLVMGRALSLGGLVLVGTLLVIGRRYRATEPSPDPAGPSPEGGV